MTAVIYARYSSDNQREESIEGQIRECTAYAEKNGITIVKHYIDRAISAKTDNRPEFQQMIKDSDKKLFDIVLVWKLDRFARNRYDSARYKTQLKKNGVKLMSATEIISDGPEGIILESVLEGYAEYYSADLSEKVIRGMTENALKGKFSGGAIPFGYTINADRRFEIDPLTAPFVAEAFQRYNAGQTMREIRDWLNEKGIKNKRGGPMTFNVIQHMLSNRRYIGELKYRDVLIPDAIPPIVSVELFNDVQEKMLKNKKAPARRKAEDDYLLTTKLFCGYCGALMFGESGTSRTGEVHRYYKCATAKKHKGCKKKTVRKQWLEDLVVNQTMQLVKDDAAMESIIAKVMELQDRENTNLPLYEKQLRDAESGIQNMLNAIQAGILTSSTKERLEQLEETKRELEARIAEEKLAKPKIKEEFIRFWLMRFRKLDMSLKDQRQALVDTFINSIYLYDDKVLITFNYKEGTQTVTFGEATEVASEGNGSDLDCFTAPENAVKSKDFMAFLFCEPWLHGFCTVFARSVLSMSDDVGRCIALQSVPFFASGEQCQVEFCLHFRVGMLDLLLAFHRLLFGGKALPFVAALAVLVLIGVADTVRAAAFRDICHRFASLSSCPVEPRIEAVLRDADASACPQDTELGGAVAQVVGGTLADGQHLCDLLHRVHQLCGLRAVGRRLDGIGLSDHLHCSRIRVRLQELFRIIQRFHILVHFITHRHCSLLIMAHRRLLRAAVLIKSNDLRRDAVQRFQGGFIVLPQLGILQTLQDAPFLRFVQRGRERPVFLF